LVRGFRNLTDADFELPPAGCLIVGSNGHGKTSLIEALLYGEVFRSFRGAPDRELVRWGEDGFHVAADRVSTGYDARTRRKRVKVDGAEPRRLAEAIGLVRGAVLRPGDVELVSAGPRRRRQYLDVMLSLTEPGYVAALSRYRRALKHRHQAEGAELPAWERVLAECGRQIIAARGRWVEGWRQRYGQLCEAVGETGRAELIHEPSVSADMLAATLERTRERDLERGRTGVGPHRDDLKLMLNGRELRAYGSAGQQRTAALALRLCEAETLGAGTVCLDDAFAELDAERSRRLAALVDGMVERGVQVIAAVPKQSELPSPVDSLPRWRIEHGQVRR
jgi:DNA replication and repair protein RecF